ncbi:MAG: ABC transporter permease [Dehalococcoidia bacterium]|nr:ABC transporter permease [Dehalococcoidia bacterium]
MADSAEVVSTAAPKMAPKVRKRYPYLIDLFIRLVKQKPLGTVGGVIVLLLLLTGIFAELVAPFGYNDIYVGGRLEPPSARHFLGTDQIGRDLFSRIIFGARISMYVGIGASTIGVAMATLIGIISGFSGGRVDIVIQRIVDAWMCFPALFITLTIMAIVGPGVVQIIVVLGILYGVGASRIVRSAVIAIKNNVYVEAAKAIGCTTPKTLVRHILPNVMAPIIILFTINMGAAILAEASISFLGFGIPPPTPSWGGMLSGEGRRYMLQATWMAIFPGIALSIVVYGINMLGDALRDLLDPRLRGGLGRYAGVGKKAARVHAKAIGGRK